MKKRFVKYFTVGLVSCIGLSSCQGLFDLDSNQVLFADDNKLNTSSDSVYSVIGIVNKMQQIADRTIILGEIRADLVSLTTSANTELQALANFTAGTDNKYNKPEDYYAIINNCNFFLANADTALKKRNIPVLMKDFAVIKAYRAWTYLQLAQIYGEVPFITEPILTEKETNIKYERKSVKDLCNYFIDDLIPYINTEYPGYGPINGQQSRKFYIPIRLLLGDLCLWAERYKEAAVYYHDYIVDPKNNLILGTNRVQWTPSTNTFEGSPNNSYSNLFGDNTSVENIGYIPMEATKFDGLTSDLRNVFNSTIENFYFNQATYSNSLKELSKSQAYCKEYVNLVTSVRDTLFAPPTNVDNELFVGDLRLSSIYRKTYVNSTSNAYSNERMTNVKIGRNIWTYRTTLVYMRYVEALNRAGFPSVAFTALKYGLSKENIAKYADSTEVSKAAGSTILTFSTSNLVTIGLHARGSGDVHANNNYKIPALATKADTILFVENLICDEQALETSFEGYRMSDLIRFSLRRNDNTFIATKIASRNGAANFSQTLYDKLLVRKNWYLPLEN